MSDLFTHPFLFLLLSSAPLALAGYFVSAKRMGFYVDAVAHSGLALFSVFMVVGVIGLGMALAISIWLAILGIGIVGAFLSMRLLARSESGEPWMGELFVLSLSIAAIILSKIPLVGIDLSQLFLGQFLLVEPMDLQMLVAFNFLFVGMYAKFGRQWRLFFWDPFLYRHTYGGSRFPLWVLFFLMTALTGFLVQSVGLIYAFALMIFPGRIAHRQVGLVGPRLGVTGVGVVVLGVLGLLLSFWGNLPAGPTCALCLVSFDIFHTVIHRRDFLSS